MSEEPDNPIAAVIDAAQEVRDPLEGLVERRREDAGAAFESDVLAALVALKRTDRPAFERLRAQLKDVGQRLGALDEAIARADDDSGTRPKQVNILLELAESAERFHAPDGTAYADILVDGHRETWPIGSKGFREWLLRSYFETRGGAPGSESVRSAISMIEAQARHGGSAQEVHNRVAGFEDRIYIDLGNEQWDAIEVDAAGWRIIANPPVRFRRAAGTKALPAPKHGGSIQQLRPFLNVQSEHRFVLAVSWALAAFRHRGPYPVLALSGEHGSAKSTFTAILRAVLDPNTAPMRSLPREDQDLFIAAYNAHLLAFDNISGLPTWISDTLCRLSTGGSFAVRQLYTDRDEILFDAVRPMILNGIEDIVTRPDLADRSLFLKLEPIPEDKRRSEEEFWAAFARELPDILSALLDGVAKGLAMLAQTSHDKLPRMADFARWATACETAFWPAGTFAAAYEANRDDAVEGMIEADLVADTLRAFMAKRTVRTVWTGTATELLGALNQEAGEKVRRDKSWPVTARGLRGRLTRAASSLRKVGIDIAPPSREGHARERIFTISCVPEHSSAQPSAPSAPATSPADDLLEEGELPF